MLRRDDPLYSVWCDMRHRCYFRNHHAYADYGGRGIRVCKEWCESFLQFKHDMGPRPAGFSIEREDNDGDYTPANCKWASQAEQNKNQRPRKLESQADEIKRRYLRGDSLKGIARDLGVSYSGIRNLLVREGMHRYS